MEKKSVELSIASSGTDSDVLDVSRWEIGGIQMPSALTGATIKLQVSNDNSSWADAPDELTQDSSSGNRPNYTFTANRCVTIWPEVFSFEYMRIVSASSEAAGRTFLVKLAGR